LLSFVFANIHRFIFANGSEALSRSEREQTTCRCFALSRALINQYFLPHRAFERADRDIKCCRLFFEHQVINDTGGDSPLSSDTNTGARPDTQSMLRAGSNPLKHRPCVRACMICRGARPRAQLKPVRGDVSDGLGTSPKHGLRTGRAPVFGVRDKGLSPPGVLYHLMLKEEAATFDISGPHAQRHDAERKYWLFEARDSAKQRQWFVLVDRERAHLNHLQKMKRWMVREDKRNNLSFGNFLEDEHPRTTRSGCSSR